MKILCVCQGGNVRSAALVRVLRDVHRQNAFALGWEHNLPEPIGMASAFADYVVVMQPQFAAYIPEAQRAKVRVLDVGVDRWHDPSHPELAAIVAAAAREWAAKEFRI